MITLSAEDMVAALEGLEQRHQQVILDGLELGAERGRVAVIAATPVDQGEARRGWVVKRRSDGVELRNDTVHAAVLEEGRRPGQRPPPLAAILEWVHRHADQLGIGMARSDVESRAEVVLEPMTLKDGTELDEWEADALSTAILIRSAIAARGTPAHAIVGSRLDLLRRFAEEEVMREYETL